MEKMKGRIVNIEKFQNRATYIKQGINQGYDIHLVNSSHVETVVLMSHNI